MKQPTPEQIEAAIDKWREVYSDKWGAVNVDTIDFALRFLQKAMGEPSEDALDAAYEAPNCFDDRGIDQSRAYEVWDYIRNQMLREVENDE